MAELFEGFCGGAVGGWGYPSHFSGPSGPSTTELRAVQILGTESRVDGSCSLILFVVHEPAFMKRWGSGFGSGLSFLQMMWRVFRVWDLQLG